MGESSVAGVGLLNKPSVSQTDEYYRSTLPKIEEQPECKNSIIYIALVLEKRMASHRVDSLVNELKVENKGFSLEERYQQQRKS